ncbi:hypothetical protein V501_04652 [Pseudogymnoascus sp. VKM F-4519 (FW-2642)]|nr:hypothetical protein V501_04652 [Pseudogymnoascus sp. VKM F-4519 (FW-2642)]
MHLTYFIFTSFCITVSQNGGWVDATDTTVVDSNATKTIDFSSAVQIEASLTVALQQVSNAPAIPIPTNVTNIPEYAAVIRLSPFLPIVPAGVDLPEAEDMIAVLISSANASGTDKSLLGRQSALRVMIVGDSMSQGQQGDWTWRYRMWQWFQQNDVAVEFVGPYKGTVAPESAAAPQPPILYGTTAPTTMASTDGGYAAGVDSAFLSNSNHFAVWGRSAAVDKGLIQGVLEQNMADIMLLMLGFNDMGWFYSDGAGTIDSIGTLVANARAANPSIKFAIANVPQRSFIGGRVDLVENTQIYNNLLPDAIAQWFTSESSIYLVQLEELYSCQPGGCPAGYDGLHPNAWGEFQIASAFSRTLVDQFNIGTTPLAIPAEDDQSLVRDLPVPTNLQVFSSPQGVTATWDAVYGAYSYDLEVSIDGGGGSFSETTSPFNRWDSQWPLAGWTYAVSVRASAGDNRKGDYSGTLSAVAMPELAPPPNNVNVQPTDTGFTVTWDPPSGDYTDSIIEYNVIYWDWNPDNCQFLVSAAFTSSPGVIAGLTPGVNYLVAPVTWNANGQGLPLIANNVVPGTGTPPIPSDVVVVSNDPTTVHITWGSSSAGGYQVWSRNINVAGSQFVSAGNVTAGPCMDDYYLFPGTWNYAWAVSAFNGNEESEMSPAVVAPSPASGVTQGSPGPTCAPAAPWCPSYYSPPPVFSSVPSPSTGTPGATASSTTTGGGAIPTSFPVTTNGNCAGGDCVGGQCVDCSGGGLCIGFHCISINCLGPACGSNGICTGPNCSEVTCSGPNCRNGRCVGPSCVNTGTDSGGGTDAPLGDPTNPDDCTTITFQACNTICSAGPSTSSCSTSCTEAEGCTAPANTETTSICRATSLENIWSPTDANGYAPTLGGGGVLGFTVTTGTASIPPPTSTSTTSPPTTTPPPITTTHPTTTTPPTTTPATTTSLPYPTNTALDIGTALCFSDYNSDNQYIPFDEAGAQEVVKAFCNNNYVLGPDNTFGYVEGYGDIRAAISWAENQDGCGSKQDLHLSTDGCVHAWDTPLYECNGGSTTENYGGAFVYNANGVGGCILIDISAISSSSSSSNSINMAVLDATMRTFNSTAAASDSSPIDLWHFSTSTSARRRL